MITSGMRTILIVDDDPLVREVLNELLTDKDYKTTVATNGFEALAHASSQEFEVVLLDMNMPGKSGLEVLPELLKGHPDTAVIMVTGVTDAKTAVEAMKQGAYDYIVKPFGMEDVLVRVEKAREKRSLAMQVRNHQKELSERLLEQEKELRAMTTQLIQSVINEEALAGEVKKGRGKPKGQLPASDLQDFGSRIMRRLHGDGS